MKTTFAYVSIITASGGFRNLKFDLSNPATEHKIRNLKAGSITTFELQENDPSFVKPVGSDIIQQSITVYPGNLALLEIKIVESTLET